MDTLKAKLTQMNYDILKKVSTKDIKAGTLMRDNTICMKRTWDVNIQTPDMPGDN